MDPRRRRQQQPDKSGLRISAVSLPISVHLPAILAGSRSAVPAATIARPLEANVLVLRFGGEAVVIVTLDLLFVGRHLRAAVEARVASVIRPGQMIMAASHTHYAPATDLDKPCLGGADMAWIDDLGAKVGDAILRLLTAEPIDVQVQHGVGSTDLPVNRRRRRAVTVNRSGVRRRVTIMAPNPRGYVDRSVHRVDFLQGRQLIAVLWSMSCHPVSLCSRTAVDSHYIGHVRSRIREREHNPTLPVLFLQGFAGDCRPFIQQRPRSLRDVVSYLAEGARFRPFPNPQAEDEWMDRVDRDVSAVRARSVSVDSLRTARITQPRTGFVQADSDNSASFSGLKMGTLRIMGGSAEFVGEYRNLIGVGTDDRCITFGYQDDVFGYAATQAMIEEGGYEVVGFCAPFAVDRVNDGIQDAVLRGFDLVARALEVDPGGD